ncbi:ComF family protein [uncultured Flavobacterium sp.]|uniref:ComF family protein n=1 Tax=uncultured Flavobacterium sp. TaxID=165435 RepID=UPI0025E35869|nr:ComF family protein [uncultured Flavobacterium sp.]
MLKSLAALLFPKTCSGCNSPLLDSEYVVCTTCIHEMPYTQHYEIPNNETYKKFYGRLPLEHASSLLYFHKEGLVQQLIHNLKYKGQQNIGKLTGQWYAQQLKNVTELQSVTDVIPVPLHPKKLHERGYNQVTEFGKALADGLNVAYNEGILIRTAYNKTQTKKNLAARAEIIGSAFDVVDNGLNEAKHFLLIDDVITTGATLESCGRALLKVPNAKLSIVTIAYTHS